MACGEEYHESKHLSALLAWPQGSGRRLGTRSCKASGVNGCAFPVRGDSTCPVESEADDKRRAYGSLSMAILPSEIESTSRFDGLHYAW